MIVHTIGILPLGMVNAFLIVAEQGCVLVDAGLPGTEQKIKNTLESLGLDFSDIKFIVITHAHIDHAGNAETIRELSGAKIIAHQADTKYFSGEQKMHVCHTGWFGWLFEKTGAIYQHYRTFEPDILLCGSEQFDLSEYGLKGRVVPTPGHTDGSISVLLEEDNVAVVGDLISSGILLGGIARTGCAKRPPFEDNPQLVASQLQSMIDRNTTTFYMGHGGPLPRDEVESHIKKLNKIR